MRWGGRAPYILLLLIFGAAVFLRFYRIMSPMDLPGSSTPLGYNGVDEGIHLMSGRLAAGNYSMYTDVNPQQGPFVMMFYTMIGGDLLLARSTTALVSLLGLLCVVMIGRMVGRKWTYVTAAALLVVNYEFLKESRHASPDMFSASLLAAGFLFLLHYIKRMEPQKERQEDRVKASSMALLMISGMFLAAAVMSKLYAAVPVFFVGLYILIRILSSKDPRWRFNKFRTLELFTLALSTLIFVLVMMSFFGFGATFRGMFLDNLHRPPQEIAGKLNSIGDFLLFTSVPLILAVVISIMKRKRPEVIILSLWTFPLLIFFMVQQLTWTHYFVLLIPPISVLAGLCVEEAAGSMRSEAGHEPGEGNLKGKLTKDSIFRSLPIIMVVIFSVLSLGFSTTTVLYSSDPIEESIADDVREQTSEGEFVISGDPLIPLLADRDQPPDATNLAVVRFPELTSEELINITIEYDVRIVVLTYHLSSYPGYISWVQENFGFFRAYERPDRTSETEGDIPIGKRTFNMYHR
ncbi:MAG: ArnT family glycosyltransferase [Thermoplasmatota archaeon]